MGESIVFKRRISNTNILPRSAYYQVHQRRYLQQNSGILRAEACKLIYAAVQNELEKQALAYSENKR